MKLPRPRPLRRTWALVKRAGRAVNARRVVVLCAVLFVASQMFTNASVIQGTAASRKSTDEVVKLQRLAVELQQTTSQRGEENRRILNAIERAAGPEAARRTAERLSLYDHQLAAICEAVGASCPPPPGGTP